MHIGMNSRTLKHHAVCRKLDLLDAVGADAATLEEVESLGRAVTALIQHHLGQLTIAVNALADPVEALELPPVEPKAETEARA
jgi:hypothetical protein